MTELPLQGFAGNRPPESALVRWARLLYLGCVTVFIACIIIQVFLAGAGVLVSNNYIALHRIFGRNIQWLALGMLVVGVACRFPRRFHLLNGLMVVLYILQYLTLYLLPRTGIPLMRALHAVNALAIFWLALYLAWQVWRLRRTVSG